jgi:hypothetical protein
MNKMNGIKDGVPNAPPPDPPPHVDSVQNLPTPMSVHVDESPMTKFVFQQPKIDVNRPRNENKPLRLKALLIALLL